LRRSSLFQACYSFMSFYVFFFPLSSFLFSSPRLPFPLRSAASPAVSAIRGSHFPPSFHVASTVLLLLSMAVLPFKTSRLRVPRRAEKCLFHCPREEFPPFSFGLAASLSLFSRPSDLGGLAIPPGRSLRRPSTTSKTRSDPF